MATLTRRPKPDPEALYEAVQSYSRGQRVFRAGTRLRGDHEEVRAAFGQWMLTELPDDQKGKIRAESMWGQSIAEAADPPRPDAFPTAQPPAGRMRALGNWTIVDPALGGPRPLYAGTMVSVNDPLYRALPHLFGPIIEER